MSKYGLAVKQMDVVLALWNKGLILQQDRYRIEFEKSTERVK